MSAAPVCRHSGQSLFVSASHAGLGRLPAIVVSSIGGSRLTFAAAQDFRAATIRFQ